MLAKLEEDVHEELYDLARTDKLTPQRIVSHAVECGDSSAAYRWLDQHGAFDPDRAMHHYAHFLARRLIRGVRIEYPDDYGKVHHIRAFVSLADERQSNPGYRMTLSVLSDEDMRKRMESTFLAELRAFERRYQVLSELVRYRDLFDVIRRVQDDGDDDDSGDDDTH